MSESLQRATETIWQSLEGGHWWLLLAALLITVIVRVVFWKLFKFAMNVLFFLLIYVLVILGLSYWIT